MSARKKKARVPRRLAALPSCVMGLDLSLRSTGIAVIGPRGQLDRAEVVHTGKLAGADRIAAIRDRVIVLVHAYNPDEIVAEFFNAVHTSQSSTHAVWLHGAVMTAIVATWSQKNPLYIAPSTLKKWMSGRGSKVEKEEMVRSIAEQYGTRIEEHDAAEAYGLAVLGLERARYAAGMESLRGRDFTAYEKGVMPRWARAF